MAVSSPQAVRIPTQSLEQGQRFEFPLVHLDGTLLLLPGLAVDGALLRALGEAGIDEVCLCRAPEAVRQLRDGLQRQEVNTALLPEGRPLDRNLYDEKGALVCERGQSLSDAVLGSLARRGMLRLYEVLSEYEAVRERFEDALARAVLDTIEERTAADKSILRVERGETPLARSVRRPKPAERTRESIDKERRLHALALAGIHGFLERVRREGRLDLPAAYDIATDLLDRAEHDLPLVLALADTALHSDYLVDHSLSVAAHVIAVGIALDYDRAQCAELALGGLIHDIGMARVSEQIIKKEGPLTSEDLAEIRAHPRLGLDILSRVPGVAMPLTFAVYHEQERGDGGGYPEGRRDGLIHDHAKAIAVADVYQAMIAPRPYKPRSTPHRAVLQILRMVQDETLDALAVQAFLTTHGIYPVGSWVRLSDGAVARSVDANPMAYDRPFVTILTDAGRRPLEFPVPADLLEERAMGVAEGLDAEALRFEFSAGLHLEGPSGYGRGDVVAAGPAEAGAEEAPPVSRPGERADPREETRVVPTEFVDWSASFSGRLSDFGVLDLLQILGVSQKSGVLTLAFPHAEGEIRLAEGEMLSAEYASDLDERIEDEEAIYRMAELREGTFRFEQGVVGRTKRIKSNATMVLMEACRRMDERTPGREPCGAPPSEHDKEQTGPEGG